MGGIAKVQTLTRKVVAFCVLGEWKGAGNCILRAVTLESGKLIRNMRTCVLTSQEKCAEKGSRDLAPST